MDSKYALIFLQLQRLLSLWQSSDFSPNKSCKTFLGPMLLPGGRNWPLIFPHYCCCYTVVSFFTKLLFQTNNIQRHCCGKEALFKVYFLFPLSIIFLKYYQSVPYSGVYTMAKIALSQVVCKYRKYFCALKRTSLE